MNRRNFLLWQRHRARSVLADRRAAGMGGSNQALAETFEVTKTEAEWRALLDDKQFAVLRQEDTEYPGSSPLLHEKRKGTFTCAGCDLPLYSSETKFESGTGWPSFWDALPDAVGTESRRLAVHDAHRSALPPLRRASRPCLRRRPAADRKAPLHQRRGAEFQACDRLTHFEGRRSGSMAAAAGDRQTGCNSQHRAAQLLIAVTIAPRSSSSPSPLSDDVDSTPG